MERVRCKERVSAGPRTVRFCQCSRWAWKDGYCKQHHPETVKAREEARAAKFNEQQKKSPWVLLEKASKRIAELEVRLAMLEGKK